MPPTQLHGSDSRGKRPATNQVNACIAAQPPGIHLGEFAGARWHLGFSLLLLCCISVVAACIWAAIASPATSANGDLPLLSVVFSVSLIGVSLLQGFLRCAICRALGGFPLVIRLRLTGAWGPASVIPGGQRVLLALSVPLVTLLMSIAIAGVLPRGEGMSALRLIPDGMFGDLTLYSVIRLVAWLLFVTSLIQWLPLPRTTGREFLAGLGEIVVTRRFALAADRLDQLTDKSLAEYHRHARLQLVLTLGRISILLCVLALAVVVYAMMRPGDNSVNVSQFILPTTWTHTWPLMLSLGAIIWVTRGGHEAISPTPAIAGTAYWRRLRIQRRWRQRRERNAWETGRSWNPWARYRRRQQQRQLLSIQAAEHQEADDVARLDGLLDKIQREGRDALSEEENGVLQRVSVSLKRTHSL